MKKIIIPALLLANLNLLFLFQIKGQYSAISDKDHAYSKLHLNEKIFVHIDRELYVAGDNIFYKLYLNQEGGVDNQELSQYAYIVIRNENSVVIRSIVKLDKNVGYGSIYIPDTLKSGVYQLVSFTNYMKNFGEAHYYYKNILIINRFDKMLSSFYSNEPKSGLQQIDANNVFEEKLKPSDLKIILENDSFKVRKNIHFKISNPTQEGKYKNAKLSLSVKEYNPISDQIVPRTSFSEAIKEETKHIDYNPETDFIYLRENQGIYIRGKVKADDKIFSDECIVISSPDTTANIQYTFTDKLGNFQILLENYYLGRQIIIKLRSSTPKYTNAEFIIEDKFEVRNKFIPVMPRLSIEAKKYIFSCQDILHIHKSYNIPKVLNTNTGLNEKIVLPIAYSTVNSRVYPNQFVPLENFREIVANLLNGVKMVREKKESELYVFNYQTNYYFNYQPAIFLDGVLIDNLSQINTVKSEDLERIDVCNVLKFKGELNFPGIVSLFTNKKRVNYITFNKPVKKLKMENLMPNTEYIVPEHTMSKNNPDFRQLLYWNPNISITSNREIEFEFTASDYISEYLIEIKGFTETGEKIEEYEKFVIYK